MSYAKDLDEYTTLELMAELHRREQDAENKRCDYCHRPYDEGMCKFSERHSGAVTFSFGRLSPMDKMQARAIADSRAWFPDLHESPKHALAHHLCGLVGEVGELIGAAVDADILDHHHPLAPALMAMMALGDEANKAKKANRSGNLALARAISLDMLNNAGAIPSSEGATSNVAHEAADVAIYLLDVAADVGFSLAEAIEAKRAVLIERWGHPS